MYAGVLLDIFIRFLEYQHLVVRHALGSLISSINSSSINIKLHLSVDEDDSSFQFFREWKTWQCA